MRRFTPDSTRAQIEAIMVGFGADAHTVRICTEVMYATDLSGIDSHGISMLPIYLREIAAGTTDPRALPEITRSAGAFSLIDGHQGFGHTAAHLGMSEAIAKARELGVGLGSVGRANHFGAAGYYARMAAEAGLMGIALCSTREALQTPTGSRHPLMGTNPLAFAAPVTGEEPIVVDMASSVVPLNKVKVYGLKGEPLPADWVVDDTGRVESDAAVAHAGLYSHEDRFGLLPIGGRGTLGGGHKGYALATMIQLLSAAIPGADQPGSRTGFHDVGYFFLAIDTELINPGVADDYAKELRDTLRGLDPVDPDRPVQVAGDPETRERAEREARGIPLADTLVDQLRGVCAETGAEFLLRGQA